MHHSAISSFIAVFLLESWSGVNRHFQEFFRPEHTKQNQDFIWNWLMQKKVETLKQEILDIIVCFYVNRQCVSVIRLGHEIGSAFEPFFPFVLRCLFCLFLTLLYSLQLFCFGWVHFSSSLPFWNLLFISDWPTTLQATTQLRKLNSWRHLWNPESELTSLGHLALTASLTKLLEMWHASSALFSALFPSWKLYSSLSHPNALHKGQKKVR